MLPLFPSLPGNLRRVSADLGALTRQVDSTPAPDDPDRPWLKLTARYSGNGLYAYTEQMFDANGAFIDKPGGRAGTVAGLAGATETQLPAAEMNGEVISAFPHYVRGERSQAHPTYGVLYYFKSNAPPAAGTTWTLADTQTGTQAGGTLILGFGGSGNYYLFGRLTFSVLGASAATGDILCTTSIANGVNTPNPSQYFSSLYCDGTTTGPGRYSTHTIATYLPNFTASLSTLIATTTPLPVTYTWELEFWHLS